MFNLDRELFDLGPVRRGRPGPVLDPSAGLVLIIAGSGAVVLAAFATFHLISGQYLAAAVAFLPAIMLLGDICAHHRGMRWPVPPAVIMVTLAMTHVIESWIFGTAHLFWVFPTLLGGLLLSSGWAASIYAAILLVWGTGLALTLGEIALAVRFAISLALVWGTGLFMIRVVSNLREEALELSLRDPLTGAYNRRHFTDYVASTGITTQNGALLMIDIDGFKPVNDRLGHMDGDRVLRRLVGLIESALAHEDCLFRLGGDEFAVVMSVDGSQAHHRAEVLRRAVQDGLVDSEYALTISIGLVCFAPGIPVEDVVHGADMALYRAKRAGRNQVHSGAAEPREPQVAGQFRVT